MPTYNKPSNELLSIMKKYTNRGEKCKVSQPIALNGKTYKEVIFYKKVFPLFKDEPLGYIYIDEDNQVITSQNIQRELAKLAYFYQLFYSSERGVGILAALQSEESFEWDNMKSGEIIKGLDYLKTVNIPDVDKVRLVVNRLPDIREKSNLQINRLSELVNEALEQNSSFDEEKMRELYPIYENILELNFDKVKLIGTLQEYCDNVKDAVDKHRKKFKIRYNQKIIVPIIRVSDQISYFRRVIRTYRNVLGMSNSQYMRFLDDINKQKIEERFSLIRK